MAKAGNGASVTVVTAMIVHRYEVVEKHWQAKTN